MASKKLQEKLIHHNLCTLFFKAVTKFAMPQSLFCFGATPVQISFLFSLEITLFFCYIIKKQNNHTIKSAKFFLMQIRQHGPKHTPDKTRELGRPTTTLIDFCFLSFELSLKTLSHSKNNKEKRKKNWIIHIATGSPSTLMHSLHKHFNFFKISFTPSWDWNYIIFFPAQCLRLYSVFLFALFGKQTQTLHISKQSYFNGSCPN